jgi:hypothetical protein
MEMPLARLVAAGTMKATLQSTAGDRIGQHTDETYQRSQSEERELAGDNGAGAGNYGPTQKRSS